MMKTCYLVYPLEGTKWSPGFSEERFDQVKFGMTLDQVTKLLGQPLSLERWEEEEIVLRYSWWDQSSCRFCNGTFHKREINLNSEGYVSRIARVFDID